MPMPQRNEVKQCTVCDRWTSDGEGFTSGVRNPRTGETPCDNWICRRCQVEARNARLVREALDAHEKHRAA